MWPQVKAYVAGAQSKKVPRPKKSSFDTVAKSCSEPLFEARCHIFLSVARIIEPFLTKYQTDAPMLPFLSTDLMQVIIPLAA